VRLTPRVGNNTLNSKHLRRAPVAAGGVASPNAMPTRYRGTGTETRALNTFIKLVRATETLMAGLGHAMAGEGLTLGQLAVLEALLHLGPMHQRALGQKVLRSDANVTTVLDNLAGAGLIVRQRSGADRRRVVVSLTPAGRRRIEQVFPAHVRRVTAALGVLSAAEQDELARLCRKLGTALAE
jgi:MarR family 2-MHQ and catechol resistance regulon transcriptional repressor